MQGLGLVNGLDSGYIWVTIRVSVGLVLGLLLGLSPLSRERVLERFRRRLCLVVGIFVIIRYNVFF